MFAYGAYSLNESVRLKSSSGGIFYEIAKYVLDNDGIVYAARFDSDYKVKHDSCSNIEDLYLFMGSKYVQSEIGNCFDKIKKYLESNKTVLFVGTPCQNEGLLLYLNKMYPNLICLDFFCHGVPSPKVWYAYLSENFTNIKSVNFRDKGKGWKNYRLTISTDRSVIDQSRYDNLYMKLFLENVSLRPSCYNCRFKTLDRKSDFTIADYWGAQNLSPELFDDKGASIVLLHSEKAEKIWDAIKENIKNVPITKEMILQSNPMALRSVRKPITRKKFFEILDSCGMHHAAQYATQMTAKRKLYIYIKRIVKGMLGG